MQEPQSYQSQQSIASLLGTLGSGLGMAQGLAQFGMHTQRVVKPYEPEDKLNQNLKKSFFEEIRKETDEWLKGAFE